MRVVKNWQLSNFHHHGSSKTLDLNALQDHLLPFAVYPSVHMLITNKSQTPATYERRGHEACLAHTR